MQDINKILIFLAFVLVYSSVVYLIGQKQDTEIELTVSNALINDLLINPKYTDGTYKNNWHWKTYNNTSKYVYEDVSCFEIETENICQQHTFISDQALNGTTYIRIKTPINFLNIVNFVESRKNEKKQIKILSTQP